MTARIILLLAATAVMLAVLVAKVMAWSVLAGTLLASVIAGVLILYAAYRWIGTGKGVHAAPRWPADDELIPLPYERTIPRAETEHEPPWMPAPPVIEPDAVTSGPPEPEPEAIIIMAGTVSEGLTHVAVLPPLRPGELLPPVAELLGYPSVDAAMDALCAGLHSWESNFTKGDSRFVRAITDGAS